MRSCQAQTFRMQVRDAVAAAPRPLTGIEVARQVGAPYKPTIDALNALLNHGKVVRLGRKFTARWCGLPPQAAESPIRVLEHIVLRTLRD